MSPGSRHERLVRVLDADPELRGTLSDQALDLARTLVLAPQFELPEGPWRPQVPERIERHLGFLVLAGILFRRVPFGGRHSAEILGPGDVLRPWQGLRFTELGAQATWSVVEPASLAVLDERFTGTIGRWPEVVAALFARSVERSRATVVTLGISQMTGVDLRVLATFWHLAERFGHRDGDCWVVPVRLTHDMLAALARTQRPTVTSALGRLAEQHLLERRDGGCWMLPGEPPSGFTALRRALGSA